MSRIGICRNDIHAYHRMNPFISYPVTQGHGESGEIIKIDKNVKDFH
jgi:D-arabinose 1-dehydrogenase-like Zn-dependent alcohol dehydrogenase